MRKSLKVIFILACVTLLLGIISIQIIYNLNKNSETELILKSKDALIENLESTITDLEELQIEEFQREKEKIIKESFEWIYNYDWNKLTLTNASGTTIDITDSDVIKYHLRMDLMNSFKFEYIKTSPISKAYTYTFYFDDFSKEIILSNRGFVHDIWVCRNTFLYDIAEALLPVQDELDNCVYTAKQLLLDSKFFSLKKDNGEYMYKIPYSQIRYIILQWMPENTLKIDKLPSDVKKVIMNIEGFYRGKKVHLKTYTYDNIDDFYTEDYYIEFSNDLNAAYYKLVDKPNGSLWNIFSSSID